MEISTAHLAIVKAALKEHLPGVEVRAFGSRVLGTPKSWSDLDLAVVGKTRIDPKILTSLQEAFEESDLPYRVDVLDWNAISPEFRRLIESRYEALQSADL